MKAVDRATGKKLKRRELKAVFCTECYRLENAECPQRAALLSLCCELFCVRPQRRGPGPSSRRAWMRLSRDLPTLTFREGQGEDALLWLLVASSQCLCQVLKSASDEDERPNFLPAKRDVYKEASDPCNLCRQCAVQCKSANPLCVHTLSISEHLCLMRLVSPDKRWRGIGSVAMKAPRTLLTSLLVTALASECLSPCSRAAEVSSSDQT